MTGPGAKVARTEAWDARRDWLVMLYMGLVPLVVIPTPLGRPIGAADILLPLTLIVIAASPQALLQGWRVVFTLFLIASAGSTVWFLAQTEVADAAARTDVLLIVRLLSNYLPIFLVLEWHALTVSRLRRYLYALFAGGTASVVIGVILHHAGVQVRDAQQTIWYGSGFQTTLRAGGLLGNSGDYGHISAIVGVAAITLGVVYLRRPLLCFAIFVVSCYATYLSSSRAAMLHLLIAFVIMVPFAIRGKRYHLRVLVGAGALGTVLFALLGFNPGFQTQTVLRRLDVLNLTGESLFFASSGRTDTWASVLRLQQHDWLFGIGYGRTIEVVGSPGDNSFITIGLELGLIAGALFVLFWIMLVYSAVASPRGVGRVAAVSVVASEIAHMLTVDTHRMWATTPVAVLLVGLAITAARMQLDRDPSNPALSPANERNLGKRRSRVLFGA